eukprot:1160177-Pelagomonas_calceolata.AAC.6
MLWQPSPETKGPHTLLRACLDNSQLGTKKEVTRSKTISSPCTIAFPVLNTCGQSALLVRRTFQMLLPDARLPQKYAARHWGSKACLRKQSNSISSALIYRLQENEKVG